MNYSTAIKLTLNQSCTNLLLSKIKYSYQTITVKLILSVMVISTSCTAPAQSTKSAKAYHKKWELAKGHFSDESYDMALMLFQSLSPEQADNPYVEYANYYAALCYFKLGKLNNSREYLLRLRNKYPNWDKKNHASYLLANIEFIHSNYARALDILNENTDHNSKDLKLHYLSKANYAIIKQLHSQYPNDKEVGTVLAYRTAMHTPLLETEKETIYHLISENEIHSNKLKHHLESTTESHFKDTFNIALIYPFQLDQLKQYNPIRSNQFVIDHCAGLNFAIDSLRKENIHLKINHYDSKNDTSAVKNILVKEELKHMDVVIGPAYSKNMPLVSSFCSENQIMCINPFSSKSSTVIDTGFVYMYNPSDESIGKNAAQLVLDSFPQKEIIVICYNTRKDTVIANAFEKMLAENGKTVSHKIFVKPGEDVLYPLSRINRATSAEGIIFAPSKNTSIASAITSFLIMREINIPIIGNASWFDSREFNIVNFRNRKAYFYDENYIKPSAELTSFEGKYLEKYNIPPSNMVFKGYDLGLFIGYNLSTYGKYFNQALWNMEIQNGVFYPELNYKSSYCNNFVPILKFEDYQLIPHNFSIENTNQEIENDIDQE